MKLRHLLSSYLRKPRKEIIDDVFILFAALTIVSLPFAIRLNSIVIVLFGVCWMLQNNYGKLWQVMKTSKMFWFNISLYLLSVISMLYTQNQRDGKFELEKEFSLFLFPLIFASTRVISTVKINFILWLFILANLTIGLIGVFYATYCYFQYHVNYFFYHDLVILFHFHATYFSMYLSFCIAALLYLYAKHRNNYSWKMNVVLFMIIAFFITLIFLLAVRSIIIFFSLSTLAGILIFTIRKRKYKLGLSLLVGFVAVIYFGINKNQVLKDRLLQIKDNYKYEFSRGDTNIYNGFTTRLAQWECSYNIIKKSPLFGVGIGDVQDELQIQYKKNLLNYSFKGRFNAHNQYFQTAMGLGVTGLFILLAGLVIPFFLAYRQRNYLYLGFIFLFASCCLTESMLCMQQGVVFYCFFNSLFLFHTLKKEVPLNESGKQFQTN